MILATLTALGGRYAMDDNHPDLRWETLQTEHFRVHYPVSRRDPAHPRWVSGERTAQRVAATAEDLWLQLRSEVGYWPNERVHVVILEDTDRLRGFTLTPQDWVVFSGNPGPELARTRGRVDWVEDLLAHELAHVLTLKKSAFLGEAATSFGVELGGLVEDGANQIGVTVAVEDPVPHWFSEGAAEFWSERVGVNTWTSARRMTLTASVLDGRLLGSEEWGRDDVLEDWYDGERAYQQGYAFHRWLAEREGDGAWRRVMAASGKRLRIGWDGVFDEVVGTDLETLKREFERDLTREVHAGVAARDREGRIEGRELGIWTRSWESTDGWRADRWALRSEADRERSRARTGSLHLHMQHSADGKWFAEQRSGWVVVKRLDEGMWTAFAEAEPDWDATAGQRRESERLQVWLPSRYMGDLDFVPGADALVMTAWEGADRVQLGRERWEWTQLYRVDLTPEVHGERRLERFSESERAVRQRMEPIPGTLRARSPSVSPDGEWVAYVQYRDGAQNVFVSRIDGSDKRAITHAPDVWAEGTDWSPDGTRLVFSMFRDGQQDLWVADLVSGAVEPLFQDPHEELDPYWAADGSIWFSADPDGVYDIYRYTPGRVTQMTRVPTGAQSPSLTPDGHLYYTQHTGFGWKAYGLRREYFGWHDVTERFGGSRPPVTPTATPLEARRYRPARSLTGLAASPMLRLDRAFDGRVVPRVGAYLKVRDAVEVNTFTLHGWLGANAFARGTWVFHGFLPDVRITGSHWAGRRNGDPVRRQITTGGVSVTLPWNEGLAFDVGVLGFRSMRALSLGFGRVLSSRVVSLGVRTGDLGDLRRSNTETGVYSRWLASRGTSAGESGYTYHRIELDVHAVSRSELARDHRWVLDLGLGLTDRAVHAEDRLQLGGDHPYAIRQDWVQASRRLPGYAPFAVSGEQVGVAGVAMRFPLRRRIAQEIGPLLLHEVYAQLGGHAAFAVREGSPRWLADVVGTLRVRSVLFDSDYDSTVSFAYGRPVRGGGGFRFVLGVGTGF